MSDHGNGHDLPASQPTPEELIDEQVRQGVLVTSFNKLLDILNPIYNWGRRWSLWPMAFGLACCAIEQICTAASRYDISRFGAELFRASPRQADVMLVSGTVTKKMVPNIVRLYNQMGEPKYVIAMGACATGGGPFKEGYNVVSGIDKFLPVDVYIPGCPPTPQALLHGIMKLQEKIDKQRLQDVSWYRRGPVEEVPVPILGPDLIDPRQIPALKAAYEARRKALEPKVEDALVADLSPAQEVESTPPPSTEPTVEDGAPPPSLEGKEVGGLGPSEGQPRTSKKGKVAPRLSAERRAMLDDQQKKDA